MGNKYLLRSYAKFPMQSYKLLSIKLYIREIWKNLAQYLKTTGGAVLP